MRKLISSLVVLLFPLTLWAQQLPPLEIKQVRIGFAPSVHLVGDRATLFKAGAWAPVAVDIEVGKEGWKGGEAKVTLSIETADNAEEITVYTVPVPLPALQPKQQFTVHTFTKPASTFTTLTAILRSGDVSIGPHVRKEPAGLDASQAIYLLIGSDLAELRKILAEAKRPVIDPDDQFQRNPGMGQDDERTPEFVAVADSLDELPEQWFGYEGVDLIILSTGRREFLEQLIADTRRREALAQWVVRGGHLVVSVGKNQDLLAGMAEIESLLPVRLAGVEQRQGIMLEGLAPKAGNLPGPIEIARLEAKPGRSMQIVIGPTPGNPGIPLLVAQSPAGLGRVTVVGFDLDQNPFAAWAGRSEFLLGLIGQAWPRQLILTPQRQHYGGPDQNDLLNQLYSDMERFEEVPVISFGWVALFIFIYILIVGPLDYWFLKKVVKRLELTWITFPTVVILVSVIAYFAAYQIKGKDLRIRKLDLVDIDLRSQQAYGRTWLTIFSPRIEHYTIGLQPVAGVKQSPGNSTLLLSWLGRPVYEQPVWGQTRSQSLFRRAYDYAPNAVGLERVPIRVWTTKSFTAAWTQALAADPLVSAELRQAADNPNHVVGSITWRPGATRDAGLDPENVQLIYRGRVHHLSLVAGQPSKVELDVRDGTMVTDVFAQGGPTQGSESFMKAILFFREAQAAKSGKRNHGLRELDQSWRLGADAEEVVLVARLPVKQGPAEQVNQSPNAPTRLWLGGLPGGSTPAQPLVGVLRQDTYVRVFIPVQKQ